MANRLSIIADWHNEHAADAYNLWSRLKIDGIEKQDALRSYIRHLVIAKALGRRASEVSV